MASLRLENISKTYHNGVQAVKNLSLEIKDHEIVVIIGASGSGKSTLLRMICGLEEISEGKLYIDDILSNNIEPIERNVALVFQNYALYPQLNAHDNIAIALKQKHFYQQLFNKKGEPILSIDSKLLFKLKEEKKLCSSKEEKIKIKDKIKEVKKTKNCPTYGYTAIAKEEIEKRINKASELLELSSFLSQRVSTLSGGQKQRVAIAKAIVKEPNILLMDEPVSNLDPKLRSSARELIKKVHQETNATTIIVSHDQNDALSLADTIVLLKDGEIEQIASPLEMLNRPINTYVAKFFGEVPLNLLSVTFDNHKLFFNSYEILINEKTRNKLEGNYSSLILGIRHNDIHINETGKYSGIVENIGLLGRKFILTVKAFDTSFLVCSDTKYSIDSEISFDFDLDKILLFDSITELLIC